MPSTRTGPVAVLREYSVTFVVPARNEERFLKQCLASIVEQFQESVPSETFENSIIVVDNGSTDSTREIATQMGAKVVCLPPSNPARARNYGSSFCASTAVAFVDADCILPKGWLQKGLEHLDTEGVVAFGSIQAIPPENAPWVERTWVQMIVPREEIEWKNADWLPAFNLLVLKSDFDALSGFDESLETCEDSDFSYRLAKRGTLRRDHSFPVRHLGESQSLAQFFRREMWRSRGNLSSARKRGIAIGERASLLIPIAYLLLCGFVLLVSMFSLLFRGYWWLFLGASILGLIAIPILLSFIKFGLTGIGRRSILLGVYLVARGLGPIVPAKRLARSRRE